MTRLFAALGPYRTLNGFPKVLTRINSYDVHKRKIGPKKLLEIVE